MCMTPMTKVRQFEATGMHDHGVAFTYLSEENSTIHIFIKYNDLL